MNTDANYERRWSRVDPQPEHPLLTEADVSGLSHVGDPSLPQRTGSRGRAGDRSIVWVRPTELVTTATSPMVQRAADLQAGLARETRRAPSAAIRAGRRITRSAIARAEPPMPTVEGPQL